MIPVLPYLAVAAGCLVTRPPAQPISSDTCRWPGNPDRPAGANEPPSSQSGSLWSWPCRWGPRQGSRRGTARVPSIRARSPRDWILANVGRRTAIARERDTPVLLPTEYRLRGRDYLSTRPMEWYGCRQHAGLRRQQWRVSAASTIPATPQADAWYHALFSCRSSCRPRPWPTRTDHPDQSAPQVGGRRQTPSERGDQARSRSTTSVGPGTSARTVNPLARRSTEIARIAMIE